MTSEVVSNTVYTGSLFELADAIYATMLCLCVEAYKFEAHGEELRSKAALRSMVALTIPVRSSLW